MEWPSGKIIYIFFFINLLIVIGGIVFIVIGAKILGVESRISIAVSFSFGALIVSIGVIILLIPFLGCWGAFRESGWMLIIYIVVFALLIIIQISIGSAMFAVLHLFNTHLEPTLEANTRILFDGYFADAINRGIVDYVQQEMQCCGVKNPYYWYKQYLISPPASCYEDNDSQKKLFQHGCTESIVNNVRSTCKAIGGVAIAFAIIELVGTIFACVIKKRF